MKKVEQIHCLKRVLKNEKVWMLFEHLNGECEILQGAIRD